MSRALLQDHEAFPCCKASRLKVTNHQRPGWISWCGAFTSSKPAEWSSASGGFLLSSHRDPCLASSPPSLYISHIQLLLVLTSTTPSLLLSPSVFCIQWTQLVFFPLLLVDECSVMVSLQHPSNTVGCLISGPSIWEALRPLRCLSSFFCSESVMPASLEC